MRESASRGGAITEPSGVGGGSATSPDCAPIAPDPANSAHAAGPRKARREDRRQGRRWPQAGGSRRGTFPPPPCPARAPARQSLFPAIEWLHTTASAHGRLPQRLHFRHDGSRVARAGAQSEEHRLARASPVRTPPARDAQCTLHGLAFSVRMRTATICRPWRFRGMPSIRA
jgi:hypothetical protein